MRRIGIGLAVILLALAANQPSYGSTEPFTEDGTIEIAATATDDPFQINTNTTAEKQETDVEVKDALLEEETPPANAVEEGNQPKEETITIESGDSLWAIAEKIYGDGNRYRDIIEANKDKYPSLLKNPGLIMPGWELDLPATTTDDSTTPAAQEDDSANSSSSNDSSESDEPDVEVDDSSGSTTDALPTLPELSISEKVTKLQKAVNALNRALLPQNKRVAALTPSTVRFMIDKGFMSEEEWMALNPPAGYYWSVTKSGEIQLTDSETGKVLSDSEVATVEKEQEEAKKAEEAAAKKAAEEKKKAEEAAAKKAAEEKKKAEEAAAKKAAEEKQKAEEAAAKKALEEKQKAEEAAAKKTEEEKQKAEEAAAKKAAEEKQKAEEAAAKKKAEEEAKQAENAAKNKYEKILAENNIPDISDSYKDYRAAVNAGSKFMSKGFFGGTTPFLKFYRESEYPDYNIYQLEKDLKNAQEKYEELVTNNKTSKTLGIFGDNIESAAKKVQKAQAKLQQAWYHMKKALSAAQEKATELEKTINDETQAVQKILDKMNKIDKFDAENGEIIQKYQQQIQEHREEISDAKEKLEYFATIKEVFEL